MESRGLGFSQVVSTFWIFYFFYLKKAIKVQKSTKSKLGVFLMQPIPLHHNHHPDYVNTDARL